MLLNPIELRHKLHRIPELAFKEFETTSVLIKNISALPKIKIHRPLGTGLLVEYRINKAEYILLRADIDGLPIKEETNVSFSSINNNMHACGHDVHTAILYGFLRYVVENNINQNILFLFQPAEEAGSGAEKIIASKILENFKIKYAFALHVTDEFGEGTIASAPGVLFASTSEIDIELFGKSAHVVTPSIGKNAFNALTSLLSEIKILITEQREETIFGYGKITSGTARNIIPSYAKIEATIRTLSRKNSECFFQKIIFLLEDIKEKSDISYKTSQGSLYAEVDNDPRLFEVCRSILSNEFPFVVCKNKMMGEDFGFFSKLYPSFMFWLGTKTNEEHGLHTSTFIPRDSVIELGIKAFTSLLQ